MKPDPFEGGDSDDESVLHDGLGKARSSKQYD